MALILKALTLETQSGMHAKEIRIDHFPFRVGRENRGPYASMRRMGERRSGEQGQTNDLYLWDSGEEYYISQRHFSIEKEKRSLFSWSINAVPWERGSKVDWWAVNGPAAKPRSFTVTSSSLQPISPASSSKS